MRVVQPKCERCGAALSLEPDGSVVRCRYCGAEMLVGGGAPKKSCEGGSVTGCAAWVDALLNTNEPKKALEAAQRGIEIDANNPAALWELGNALAVAGEVDQAVAAFRRAVKNVHVIPKDGEMPTYDEPLPLSIKRDLTNLLPKFPASRDAIDKVLSASEAEWASTP